MTTSLVIKWHLDRLNHFCRLNHVTNTHRQTRTTMLRSYQLSKTVRFFGPEPWQTGLIDSRRPGHDRTITYRHTNQFQCLSCWCCSSVIRRQCWVTSFTTESNSSLSFSLDVSHNHTVYIAINQHLWKVSTPSSRQVNGLTSHVSQNRRCYFQPNPTQQKQTTTHTHSHTTV